MTRDTGIFLADLEKTADEYISNGFFSEQPLEDFLSVFAVSGATFKRTVPGCICCSLTFETSIHLEYFQKLEKSGLLARWFTEELITDEITKQLEITFTTQNLPPLQIKTTLYKVYLTEGK